MKRKDIEAIKQDMLTTGKRKLEELKKTRNKNQGVDVTIGAPSERDRDGDCRMSHGSNDFTR